MEPSPLPVPPAELLSMEEAAAYLGRPVGWMYKVSAARRIRSYRVGRYVRFDKADLDAFVQPREAVSS